MKPLLSTDTVRFALAAERGKFVKFVLWCLAVGLEVWLGVFAILMGIFALMSMVDIPREFESVIGLSLTICGSVLVAHAVRRELKARIIHRMETLGNPLDSPTQA